MLHATVRLVCARLVPMSDAPHDSPPQWCTACSTTEVIHAKPNRAISEMRRAENIVGAEAASQTADNTIVASCTSSIGLARGTHGNGALSPATNKLLVQPRPISTNTVVVNALRLRS